MMLHKKEIIITIYTGVFMRAELNLQGPIYLGFLSILTSCADQ